MGYRTGVLPSNMGGTDSRDTLQPKRKLKVTKGHQVHGEIEGRDSPPDFDKYWAQLEPRTKSGEMERIFYPPSVGQVLKWAISFNKSVTRPAFLVLPSSTILLQYRSGIVESFEGPDSTSWLEVGALESLTQRIAAAKAPATGRPSMPLWFPPNRGNWELLWGLIAVEDFVVDEPLRSMLDQSLYLIHDVYRMLWEIRFLAKENVNLKPAQDLAGTMTRWILNQTLTAEDEENLLTLGIRKKVSDIERYDLICFLATLAAQNGIVSRIVFRFNNLEQATEKNVIAIRQLYHFIRTVERWIKIGPCPIGVLIGHTGDRQDLIRLKSLHERLTVKVMDGLAWTRENAGDRD